ncbi:MAG: PilT/PilU family type 4a pilus ATPase [Verrucomicrobiota bacterium]
MSTIEYNEWIISSCLEAGWIDDEAGQRLTQAVAHLGGNIPVLDLMEEQEILPKSKLERLKTLIQEHQSQSNGASEDKKGTAQESTSHSLTSSAAPQTTHSLLEFIRQAISYHASDLHIGPHSPPFMRRFGALQPLSPDYSKLTPDDSEALARQFLTPKQIKSVEEEGSIDFCYTADGIARLRASVIRQRRGWECVFRIIAEKILTMQEIGLPPVCYEMVRYHNGLILVTGPVSSGKTTTLAAMVNQINHERKEHIITLEEPIEYVFPPAGCQITQREIRQHTESFATALKGSLRQDPDVIMVGEMRDLETISLAITASETGHLVLATLHTSTAARTMQRLLDVFPSNQQAQIRTMVSESIRGVICQKLVPRLDGSGRILALEIMTNTPAISNLIREGQNFQIPGMMQIGRNQGMMLMDDSLIELAKQGVIAGQAAYNRAENKKLMAAALAAEGIN